jgi:DNA (cytosine-5)-methyltransferase 1
MIHGLALCAGVGGLEQGVQAALGGHYRTVCYVERDAYAAAVLVARMEDKALAAAPVWDDLLTFGGLCWRGKVDLVTAGLPCQPYSTAGKRRADKDARALWPAFVDAVRDAQPSAIFLENVPPFLKHFEAAFERLRALGFEFAPPLRASAIGVGAPHRRRRVFIFAAHAERMQLRDESRWQRGPSGAARQAQLADAGGRALADAESVSEREPRNEELRTQGRARSIGGRGLTTSDAGRPGFEGGQRPGALRAPSPTPGAAAERGGVAPDPDRDGREGLGCGWVFDVERTALRHDADRCRGGRCHVGPHWQAQSPVLRVDARAAGGLDELRVIGNAVMPQVAEAAFKILLKKWLEIAEEKG